jgi:hypothetical protein
MAYFLPVFRDREGGSPDGVIARVPGNSVHHLSVLVIPDLTDEASDEHNRHYAAFGEVTTLSISLPRVSACAQARESE